MAWFTQVNSRITARTRFSKACFSWAPCWARGYQNTLEKSHLEREPEVNGSSPHSMSPVPKKGRGEPCVGAHRAATTPSPDGLAASGQSISLYSKTVPPHPELCSRFLLALAPAQLVMPRPGVLVPGEPQGVWPHPPLLSHPRRLLSQSSALCPLPSSSFLDA